MLLTEKGEDRFEYLD